MRDFDHIRSAIPPGQLPWGRLENPEWLGSKVEQLPNGEWQQTRLARIATSFGAVLVVDRLRETVDETAEPHWLIVSETAMVANRLVIQAAPGRQEADLRAAVASAGLELGRPLGDQGTYLVRLPAATLDAVPAAVARLQQNEAIAYAEPDYLVFTADVPDKPPSALARLQWQPPTQSAPVPSAFPAQAPPEASNVPLGAHILTFDPPTYIGGFGMRTPYMEEQYFRISTDVGLYVQKSGETGGAPNNSGNYARSASSETNLTIRHRENLPFTLYRIDLAEYSTVFPTPKSITFTGYRADGSTVTQTFVTDGVIDGSGPLSDFQTFAFSANFTHLTKVVVGTTTFALDNVVLEVESVETPLVPPPELPVLYRVTWDAPEHPLDEITAVGGPFAPTTIEFGTPTVRAQAGNLTDRPLVLQGTGYQQISWWISKNAGAYQLDLDANVHGPTFTILFDGTEVQRLDFNPNGTITRLQTQIGGNNSVGHYSPSQKTHITVKADRQLAEWQVFIDGVWQFTGRFLSANDVSTIRLHTTNTDSGFVAVDNVVIQAFDVPDPTPSSPRLEVSPSRLAFGPTALGTSKDNSVIIKNTGLATLRISSVTSSNPLFEVDSSIPTVLANGQTTILWTTFTPEGLGNFSGNLILASNDPDAPETIVAVTGEGMGYPRIEVEPPDLGLAMLAGSTVRRDIQLRNVGTGTLVLNLIFDPIEVAGSETPGGERIPNDPELPNQWSMRAPQAGSGGIDAVHAWSLATGDGAVVAVIDTGVDYRHWDLQENIWTNPNEIPGNEIDDDSNGYVDDVHGWDFFNEDNDPMDGHGHGTHVAGIIAARGDNRVGVAGVAWKAKILPLKFLADAGYGTDSDAVRALNYAVRAGVRITSNSWGFEGYSQALYDAIRAARDAGCLFVAAAGNQNSNLDDFPFNPAGYDLTNIVSVAASDEHDFRAYFSNYGPASVDLAAPGIDILSLLPGNGYGPKSGTSMSAPLVSGVAALLLGQTSELPLAQIKQLLLDRVDMLPALNGMMVSGGRLNADNAVRVRLADWLTALGFPGEIAPGGTQTFSLRFAAPANALELQRQTLHLRSNDATKPEIALPAMLEVLPPTGYHTWQVATFGSGGGVLRAQQGSVWGDDADPDRDGVGNLLEYVLNLSPVHSDNLGWAAIRRVNEHWQFEFRIRDPLDGVRYHVEWADLMDPAVWRTEGLTTNSSVDGQPPGTRLVTSVLAQQDMGQVFFRLVGERDE